MPEERSADRRRVAVESLPILMGAIGIAAAAVVLFAPDAHGALVDESTIFANRVRAARDAAIVDGRPVGVRLTSAGYGFAERTGTRWVPMPDAGLQDRRWRPGIRTSIPAPSGRARIVFDRTGAADRDLVVTFAHRREAIRVIIGTSGNVEIRD